MLKLNQNTSMQGETSGGRVGPSGMRWVDHHTVNKQWFTEVLVPSQKVGLWPDSQEQLGGYIKLYKLREMVWPRWQYCQWLGASLGHGAWGVCRVNLCLLCVRTCSHSHWYLSLGLHLLASLCASQCTRCDSHLISGVRKLSQRQN